MPFDATPKPILDPSVRDLLPRERLERLGEWLYAGGPGKEAWDYSFTMNECGTIGCAIGWYRKLTGYAGNGEPEFNITGTQRFDMFIGVGDSFENKSMKQITPQDVAKVIDMVLDGKIK